MLLASDLSDPPGCLPFAQFLSLFLNLTLYVPSLATSDFRLYRNHLHHKYLSEPALAPEPQAPDCVAHALERVEYEVEEIGKHGTQDHPQQDIVQHLAPLFTITDDDNVRLQGLAGDEEGEQEVEDEEEGELVEGLEEGVVALDEGFVVRLVDEEGQARDYQDKELRPRVLRKEHQGASYDEASEEEDENIHQGSSTSVMPHYLIKGFEAL
jgi:hypothetical protein